jgi:hypothetical protein
MRAREISAGDDNGISLRSNSEPAILLRDSQAMESRKRGPAKLVPLRLLGEAWHFDSGALDEHGTQSSRVPLDPGTTAAELTDQVWSSWPCVRLLCARSFSASADRAAVLRPKVWTARALLPSSRQLDRPLPRHSPTWERQQSQENRSILADRELDSYWVSTFRDERDGLDRETKRGLQVHLRVKVLGRKTCWC